MATAAVFAFVVTLPETLKGVRAEPDGALVLLGLAVATQLMSVEVYGRGALSAAAVGLLATAFVAGVGPAMAVAVVAAGVRWAMSRGVWFKSVFDMANFALSAGVGGAAYEMIVEVGGSTGIRLVGAVIGGVIFGLVNSGLLCTAMSASERLTWWAVWRERFAWEMPYLLAYGPFALALAIAYERLGGLGLVAFTLPVALTILSMRQYVSRTEEAVHEIRRANGELEVRNDDLRRLVELAGGLAARTNDRRELVTFVEREIERLVGARPSISVQGSRRRLVVAEPGDPERWARIGELIGAQVASAVETAELVEKVRKTHLATIAALSRSMEAKDGYTSGHTERVSDVALALGRRLGYSSEQLHAIEIAALLHDIGKIGIPERILHKAGPLDDEEWEVMRTHPKIGVYILSGIDLPEEVMQVARSSHERWDGKGYPDGLRGEEIPLPARVVLVADAFDALTSDRPYRSACGVEDAIAEIRANAGTQFCPTVTEALLAIGAQEPEVLGAAASVP